MTRGVFRLWPYHVTPPRRPVMDVSEPALDPGALPPRVRVRTPDTTRHPHPWFQRRARLDVGDQPAPDLELELIQSRLGPRPYPRGYHPWLQYHPRLDVSEPALDLEAIPARLRVGPREPARPYQYWVQRPARALPTGDDLELLLIQRQRTHQRRLRPGWQQWHQYRSELDVTVGVAAPDEADFAHMTLAPPYRAWLTFEGD